MSGSRAGLLPLLSLSVSTVPLFLCAYCSSLPLCPLFLCYSAPINPLFLCAYCFAVHVSLLFLCAFVPLFLCTYCSSVPLCQLFLCSSVPLHLLFLCSSVSTVLLCICQVFNDVSQVLVHEPWALPIGPPYFRRDRASGHVILDCVFSVWWDTQPEMILAINILVKLVPVSFVLVEFEEIPFFRYFQV